MLDRPVRVLFVAVPPLVRDLLVEALAACDEIELLAVDLSLDRLAEQAALADVVVVDVQDGHVPVEAEAVLANHGVPAFLGLESHDGSAELVWLTPHRKPLGRLTPDEVAAEVRRVGAAT
jgi:hypothetical protein